MGSNVTQRDRVWAAIAQQHGNFRLYNVESQIEGDYSDKPSKETIRRVLRAATELGVIKHRSGSQYYRMKDGSF